MRRGKRLLLLLWPDAYPLGFALGYALWACWAYPALLTAHWLQGVIIVGYVALKFAEDYYAKQVGKRSTHPEAPASAGTY